jgi:hypothetical protein
MLRVLMTKLMKQRMSFTGRADIKGIQEAVIFDISGETMALISELLRYITESIGTVILVEKGPQMRPIEGESRCGETILRTEEQRERERERERESIGKGKEKRGDL